MKVSIITATCNSAGTVAQTLRSVAQQTHPDIEHIIVDNLSIDGTVAIAKSYPHITKIISEKDAGIYDAMNKGILACTGDIVGILNSDDFFPDHLVVETIVNMFVATNCDAIYGDLFFVDKNSPEIIRRQWYAGGYHPSLFYRGWMPPHPTFYVKRECYEKFGMFNTSFKVAADYDLLLRFFLKHKIKVQCIRRTLVHMRDGGISNRGIIGKIRTHLEDHRAWWLNGLHPHWYTVYCKPLRKVKQFAMPWLRNHKLFKHFISSQTAYPPFSRHDHKYPSGS